VRLESTEEIKLDEKWKNDLTQKDFASFHQMAGKLNCTYGCDQLYLLSQHHGNGQVEMDACHSEGCSRQKEKPEPVGAN
jgi:hypothetical protein